MEDADKAVAEGRLNWATVPDMAEPPGVKGQVRDRFGELGPVGRSAGQPEVVRSRPRKLKCRRER